MAADNQEGVDAAVVKLKFLLATPGYKPQPASEEKYEALLRKAGAPTRPKASKLLLYFFLLAILCTLTSLTIAI